VIFAVQITYNHMLMSATSIKQLVLASQSPRRRELLQQLHLDFHVHVVQIDETVRAGEKAEAYVQRMANEKAMAAYLDLRLEHKKFGQLLVLGADTAVIIDQQILGKPDDRKQAHEYLQLLSGRTHTVMTAVTLASGADMQAQVDIQTLVSHSAVEFASLTVAQIATYLDTEEPYDKAGSYAVQGLAAQFIRQLTGSYSGVMGLPLYETAQLLRPHGYVI